MVSAMVANADTAYGLDNALTNNDRAYHLMVPERKAESAALKAFRDWLLNEAYTYQQQ